MIAKRIYINLIVEEAAFVIAGVDPILLAWPVDGIPGLTSLAVMPVIYLAAMIAAAQVGPFELVGATIVDATARGDTAA